MAKYCEFVQNALKAMTDAEKNHWSNHIGDLSSVSFDDLVAVSKTVFGIQMEHMSSDIVRLNNALEENYLQADVTVSSVTLDQIIHPDKFDMSLDNISSLISLRDLRLGIPNASIPRLVRFRIYLAFKEKNFTDILFPAFEIPE